jgi:hypothetical protein
MKSEMLKPVRGREFLPVGSCPGGEAPADPTNRPESLALEYNSVNKQFLLKRGWTRTSIKRILGEPDRRVPLRSFPERPARDDRPECRYSMDRVLAAEKNGFIRFRKAPKRREPTESEFWDFEDRLLPCLPGPGVPPANWLPKLTRWDFGIQVGVRYPWRVNRLIFTLQDGLLHAYVGHVSGVRWPCPKCGRPSPLYDHLKQTTWVKRVMVLSEDVDPTKGCVPVVVLGRIPRCQCSKHGSRSIQPLLEIAEAPTAPDESDIEWVVRPSI